MNAHLFSVFSKSTVASTVVCYFLFNVFYSVCLRFNSLDSSRQRQMASKLVSVCHALFSFVYAALCITSMDFQHIIISYSVHTSILLGCSCGYFLYDIMLCLFILKDRSLANTLHHGTSLLCLCAVAFAQRGAFFLYFQLLTECTTPLLHSIWILRSWTYYQNHWLIKVIAVLLVLCWIPFRVLQSLLYIPIMMTNWNQYWEVLRAVPGGIIFFGIVVGSVLNFYWFYLLLKKLFESFKGKVE
ncbi:hypothetical protein GEMRC1_003403 [Eukaryota sp. GEM-RC1]